MAQAQVQGWTPVAEPQAQSAPAAPDGWTPVPAFKQTDTTPNELDPNTAGTFFRHVWQGINPVQLGQLLPFPKALGGSGMDNPLLPGNVIKSAMAVKQQADALWAKGDHVGAAAKYAESLVPILGPMMSKQGDEWQQGKYMAAAGDSAALVANSTLVPKVTQALANRVVAGPPKVAPNPTVQFAQDRNVPLDAATVSDNPVVKGAQALADRSLAGSAVATRANAARAGAMERVGGELADETGGVATTPEQAGTTLRRALTEKVAGHTDAANQAYDTLRDLEAQPGNRMQMPLKPQAVDALAEGQAGQLRRIVHELDAAPFTPRLLKPSGVGGSMEHVEGTGGAGAKVFDDIVQRMGGTSTPTRGVVQNQLETYLGGGPETNAVKAAIDVATARSKAQGGFTVSRPELPASAMELPTRLEAARVTSEEMGLPVDLSGPKQALRPLYEQMKRQMPITQQQASPGLKAIENILTGPDYAPLSQIDRDLGAIKSVAREHGGLAKMAVSQLDRAVTAAAKNGGPEVWQTLRQGRQATIAKYATGDVLETLSEEPVKAIRAITAPKDAAIQQLRTVAQHVPQQIPEVARGYLEDLLERPQRVADWNKLGSETKAILFPKAGQAQALDTFFRLTDRISKTNINPSGSGYTNWMAAQAGAAGTGLVLSITNPGVGLPALGVEGAIQIGGATLAKLLRSPAAVGALNRGLALPASAPPAIRAAATANLIRAAQTAGVSLALPKAAQQTPNRDQRP